jgi:4'-phosphopantetheinyl transferase
MERPLHFNISHTSSLIACGITMDTPVCSFLLLDSKLENQKCPYFCCCGTYAINILFFCLSQIGIDIEDKKRKTAKNILSLARRYFTPSEIDYLAKIPDPDGQQKEFIKLWTLKVSELS